VTPSQTTSGFLLGAVVDNTDRLFHGINDQAAREVEADKWYGVALYWPEADATCGPANYTLSDLWLPLTVAASTLVNVSVQLYSASE